ncbi:hypothetical protein C8Q76DRAFT_787748 [Earliella scabrosa]|nr:hypothetical protein C8Q76DRAFT_787748 [Earliella scabrosa]
MAVTTTSALPAQRLEGSQHALCLAYRAREPGTIHLRRTPTCVRRVTHGDIYLTTFDAAELHEADRAVPIRLVVTWGACQLVSEDARKRSSVVMGKILSFPQVKELSLENPYEFFHMMKRHHAALEPIGDLMDRLELSTLWLIGGISVGHIPRPVIWELRMLLDGKILTHPAPFTPRPAYEQSERKPPTLWLPVRA